MDLSAALDDVTRRGAGRQAQRELVDNGRTAGVIHSDQLPAGRERAREYRLAVLDDEVSTGVREPAAATRIRPFNDFRDMHPPRGTLRLPGLPGRYRGRRAHVPDIR